MAIHTWLTQLLLNTEYVGFQSNENTSSADSITKEGRLERKYLLSKFYEYMTQFVQMAKMNELTIGRRLSRLKDIIFHEGLRHHLFLHKA